MFADGDKSWVQYGPDLISNSVFQDYIDKIPELMLLRYTALEASWAVHCKVAEIGNSDDN